MRIRYTMLSVGAKLLSNDMTNQQNESEPNEYSDHSDPSFHWSLS